MHGNCLTINIIQIQIEIAKNHDTNAESNIAHVDPLLCMIWVSFWQETLIIDAEIEDEVGGRCPPSRPTSKYRVAWECLAVGLLFWDMVLLACKRDHDKLT